VWTQFRRGERGRSFVASPTKEPDEHYRQHSRSRRNSTLAAASGLAAVASVAVTLVVSGAGGSDATSPLSVTPATATPDPATLYRNEAALGRLFGQGRAPSAAERFHHFR
jgi:uncharacterized protein YcbX